MIQTRTVTLEIPIPEPIALERTLWVLVAVGLAADVATTFAGLELGLVETNPAARGAINTHGLAGMLALKAGAIGVGLFCRPLLEGAYRSIIPAGLALPWLAAAAINVYMMTRIGVLA
jgi:hypothetical protein